MTSRGALIVFVTFWRVFRRSGVSPADSKRDIVVRSRRRTLVGVVTSDKMEKTIRVRVERFMQHSRFEKTLRVHAVCCVHDEKREARRGDRVEIMETRPISKRKHWRLVRVIERARAGHERDAREAARPAPKGREGEEAAPPQLAPPGPAE